MLVSNQFLGRFGLALGLISALCTSALAQADATLSPRNASYRIDAELDVANRTIRGNQVVRWRNLGEQPTRELWFHLYWNAWRDNRSSWMTEARLGWSSWLKKKPEIEDWAYIDISAAILHGIESPVSESLDAEDNSEWLEPSAVDDALTSEPIDLMSTLRFESPDDGNPHDRTVVVLSLPRAVAPGQTVEVELRFEAKIPRTRARTGYRGDYYLIAHWFPKLGVFEDGAWNCHQFHAATEFYADYGLYDLHLTVPDGYLLGSSGREVSRRKHEDGRSTHSFRAVDVHGFAWTASPDFLVREERLEEPALPPVGMRLLVQPEHQGQAERYFEATRTTLKLLGTWYGPYPYDHLTIVDPAWGSHTGGMEYPTFFTGGTRKFNPRGGDSPEAVTVHEAAHQFWYGLVGNNEIEAAWMDEGFVAYSTVRVLDTAYPPRVLVRRYLPLPDDSRRNPGAFALRFPQIELSRWSGLIRGYRAQQMTTAPAVPTYLHFPGAARAVSYGKTSLWLATLQRYLGWETFRAVLSTYFQRYRFAHPSPEDFLAVVGEVTGEDLGWFFDQVYRDAVTFDYGIASASSFPADTEGWVERDGARVYTGPPLADVVKQYRTEVVVQRHGGGWFPVEVLLVFEDGQQIRRSWEGREHWKLIAVDYPAKLDYAEVDPGRMLMLDTQRINNSRHRKPPSRLPAVKWGSKWMVWLQDYLATFTFFI